MEKALAIFVICVSFMVILGGAYLAGLQDGAASVPIEETESWLDGFCYGVLVEHPEAPACLAHVNK